MSSYYIDQIRFDDLEEALKRLEAEKELRPAMIAAHDAMEALGGNDPRRAPEMIRYLIEKEMKRISTPR